MRSRGLAIPQRGPEVRDATGESRPPCREPRSGHGQARRRSTTTRSPCGSSASRSCRRDAADDGVELRLGEPPGHVQLPGVHHRGQNWRRPVRVKWINGLVDANGNFLPHLLPVDQTLHWANPPGGAGRTRRPRHATSRPTGARADRDPPARRAQPARRATATRGLVPARGAQHPGRATPGRGRCTSGSAARPSGARAQAWTPGSAVFQYDNDQRAATMWYHDHTLGMTRANVYAGPAGFYLLRGGPAPTPRRCLPGTRARPRRSAGAGLLRDPDRDPGPLLHRGRRALLPRQPRLLRGPRSHRLQIPFMPDRPAGPSDVAPIWNPEFFGNAIVVNGAPGRRSRSSSGATASAFLNGCNSRFLILRMSNGLPFWQIGNEGGFLPAPGELASVLIGPAERADVIVDFTGVARSAARSSWRTSPRTSRSEAGCPASTSSPPTRDDRPGDALPSSPRPASTQHAAEPARAAGSPARRRRPTTRQVSLNEQESATVGSAPTTRQRRPRLRARPFGPVEADLGTLNPDGTGNPLGWDEPITENPALGATRSGRSTTSPPTPTRSTSTRSPSRSSAARRSAARVRRPSPGRPAARTRSSPTRTRSRG